MDGIFSLSSPTLHKTYSNHISIYKKLSWNAKPEHRVQYQNQPMAAPAQIATKHIAKRKSQEMKLVQQTCTIVSIAPDACTLADEESIIRNVRAHKYNTNATPNTKLIFHKTPWLRNTQVSSASDVFRTLPKLPKGSLATLTQNRKRDDRP